jgi:hypothetical protein
MKMKENNDNNSQMEEESDNKKQEKQEKNRKNKKTENQKPETRKQKNHKKNVKKQKQEKHRSQDTEQEKRGSLSQNICEGTWEEIIHREECDNTTARDIAIQISAENWRRDIDLDNQVKKHEEKMQAFQGESVLRLRGGANSSDDEDEDSTDTASEMTEEDEAAPTFPSPSQQQSPRSPSPPPTASVLRRPLVIRTRTHEKYPYHWVAQLLWHVDQERDFPALIGNAWRKMEVVRTKPALLEELFYIFSGRKHVAHHLTYRLESTDDHPLYMIQNIFLQLNVDLNSQYLENQPYRQFTSM